MKFETTITLFLLAGASCLPISPFLKASTLKLTPPVTIPAPRPPPKKEPVPVVKPLPPPADTVAHAPGPNKAGPAPAVVVVVPETKEGGGKGMKKYPGADAGVTIEPNGPVKGAPVGFQLPPPAVVVVVPETKEEGKGMKKYPGSDAGVTIEPGRPVKDAAAPDRLGKGAPVGFQQPPPAVVVVPETKEGGKGMKKYPGADAGVTIEPNGPVKNPAPGQNTKEGAGLNESGGTVEAAFGGKKDAGPTAEAKGGKVVPR